MAANIDEHAPAFEARVDWLRERLASRLHTRLSPDQADTRALMYAELVAQQERALADGHRSDATAAGAFLRQLQETADRAIEALPEYLEQQLAEGAPGGLAGAVRRFLQGARPRRWEDALEDPRHARLRELEAEGVDLALLEAALRATPTERVEQMLHFQRFQRDLAAAVIDVRAAL